MTQIISRPGEAVSHAHTTPDMHRMTIQRHFTTAHTDPYTTLSWSPRTVEVADRRREGVSFPTSWSQTAVNIVGDKYLKPYEHSLQQEVDRVVDTITSWGIQQGYFVDAGEAAAFQDELKYIMVHQLATFNSPAHFNLGIASRPQQVAACFLLGLTDSMEDILQHYYREGIVFKGGSGTGMNISKLRGKGEPLSTGGTSSGPLSFLKAIDHSAGSIKSGGAVRRAARMVLMDVDHPDIEQFIDCKVIEEQKAHALIRAGFSAGMEGDAYTTVAYQNANHSIMITDAFLTAVEQNADWQLIRRTDGGVAKTVKAKALWDRIAAAAWQCGDPGLVFYDTVQKWHSHPNHGPVSVTNPCSEYAFCTWSSCNLSCINLRKVFNRADPWTDLGHIVSILAMAQEITVQCSDYPLEQIATATQRCRAIGIGVCDLGGLLMSRGVAYDSTRGRMFTSKVFSFISAVAYLRSAELAKRKGPSEGWLDNAAEHTAVLEHRTAAAPEATRGLWLQVLAAAGQHGLRNGQVTNQMPTGTVSFYLDAVTTGIEPELAMTKRKTLIGGGEVVTANPLVGEGLTALGYSAGEIAAALSYLEQQGTLVGCPAIHAEHLPVFDCALDDTAGRSIPWSGHVDMLAAIQPHIDSATSKTVNLPSYASVDDIQQAYWHAWKSGVKTIAVYRDGSKGAQPMVRSAAAGQVATTVKCASCGHEELVPAGACMVCTRCGTTTGGCG